VGKVDDTHAAAAKFFKHLVSGQRGQCYLIRRFLVAGTRRWSPAAQTNGLGLGQYAVRLGQGSRVLVRLRRATVGPRERPCRDGIAAHNIPRVMVTTPADTASTR
jgi:hypothetical protein